MVADRKYALTRLSAGDYLLPSNDGETLLRIYSYEEDGSAAWQDADGKRWHRVTGTFWACAKYNRPIPDSGFISEDFLDWENWRTWVTGCRTRRAAIDEALDA